jgi:hypothetical protein
MRAGGRGEYDPISEDDKVGLGTKSAKATWSVICTDFVGLSPDV